MSLNMFHYGFLFRFSFIFPQRVSLINEEETVAENVVLITNRWHSEFRYKENGRVRRFVLQAQLHQNRFNSQFVLAVNR